MWSLLVGFYLVFQLIVLNVHGQGSRLVLNNPVNGTFDFIVVGSGASGTVVASRLAESGRYTVLLLEAGGEPHESTEVPFNRTTTWRRSFSDWQVLTTPQKFAALSQPGRKVSIVQGKMLGGSSNINGMAFQRGNPRDYDNWASLTGDQQFTYDNLLPFFKRMESYRGDYPRHGDHGYEGPIVVSDQEVSPLMDKWLETGRQMGFPSMDPNTRLQQSGFVTSQVNINAGKRSSPFQEYLEPSRAKVNLVVLSNAYVTKINLRGTGSSTTASGVTFIRHEEDVTVVARKEVIVCAGAYRTPQLLLLSGIGDPNHLRSVGITPTVTLPGVGRGLTDHVTTLVGPFIFNTSGITFIPSRDLKAGEYDRYLATGRGPLASTFASGVGYWSTEGNHDWPNIEYEQLTVGGSRVSDLHPEIPNLKEYDGSVANQDSATVIMNLGRGLSRGTVTLNSNNPFDPPNVDPEYYSNRVDLKNMVLGMEFIVNFYEKSEAYRSIGAQLIPNHLPGCENYKLKSRGYYKCYLRHLTFTGFHPGSSCRMGADGDQFAVVSTDFKVRGVKGLRIADASIMPDIPNSNTNAASIMIGEKGADMILRSWRS